MHLLVSSMPSICNCLSATVGRVFICHSQEETTAVLPKATVWFKDKPLCPWTLNLRRGGGFGEDRRFQSLREIPCQPQVSLKQGGFPSRISKVKQGEDTTRLSHPVRSQNVCAPQTVCLATPREWVHVWTGKTVPCPTPAPHLGKAYGSITMSRPQQPGRASFLGNHLLRLSGSVFQRSALR